MFEGHRHVSVAVATQEIDAAQVQLRTFTRLSTMKLLPDKFAASIQDEQPEPRILLENEVQLAEMTVGGSFQLHDDPCHLSASSDMKVGYGRHEPLVGLIRAHMAFDHRGLGVRLERDREPGMERAAGRHPQFERRREPNACRHVDRNAVLYHGAIDAPDLLRVIARYEPDAGGPIGEGNAIVVHRNAVDAGNPITSGIVGLYHDRTSN